ncbi:MAG: phenylalanine--tRNA ligase subunit beta [bacterium]
MHLPLSWLADFVDTSSVSPKELANLLTMSGSEVEKIHTTGGDFDKIIVAEIIAIQPHPNADKLRLATVVTDAQGAQQEVVCGAPNIEVGQKVPLAQLGAQIGDFTIEKRKIRGIESNGMLCSGKELGLGDDHSGIFLLDAQTKVGTPLKEVIKTETTFSLEITPNRPDCLSIVGLAREVAALVKKPLKQDIYDQNPVPPFTKGARGISENTESKDGSSTLKVTIEDDTICSRYAGLIIKDIKIAPSPSWLQDRLRAVDIRPINNIVDITNYILIETGQPLHAFDLQKFENPHVIVRRAQKDEKLKTLDGQERSLPQDATIIANEKGPVAMAGVMGGLETEVDSQTTSILLEAAHFDGIAVRKGAEKIGLRTEASSRFEKGTDIRLVPSAIWRAAAMIQELAGGTITEYHDEIAATGKEKLEKATTISLTSLEIKRMLGILPSQKEVVEMLSLLGFEVVPTPEKHDAWSLEITVPTWRADVTETFDIIEEIGRIYGYDKIPATIPTGPIANTQLHYKPDWDNLIHQMFVALGYNEIFNYAITSKKLLQQFGIPPEQAMELLSPLAEFECMRVSLIPDVISNLQSNIEKYPSLKTLHLYEYSRVFLSQGEKELPNETQTLTGAGFDTDFLSIKGDLETLLERLGITDTDFTPFSPEKLTQPQQSIAKHFESSSSALVLVNNKPVGFIAKLTPKFLTTIGFSADSKAEVFVFELNADLLKESATALREFQPLSKFPPVLFDAAFFVDATTPSGHVLKALEQLASKEVKLNAELFDVYQGKNVEAGKKSLAFSITFNPFNHTLNEEEIKVWQQKVIKLVEEKFGGVLRDK